MTAEQQQTPTDILDEKIIRDHYQRVKNIIQEKAKDPPFWRCGNGDFIDWYRHNNPKEGMCRLYDLQNDEDYNILTKKHRTLYWSLNFFDNSVRNECIPNTLKSPDNGQKLTIGNRTNTRAYSLAVDIDSIGDIHNPLIKKAVEDAAQYFINKTKEYLPRSMHPLFSGGGIYVFVHHRVFMPKNNNGWSEEDYNIYWYILQNIFNIYIKDIEAQFFQEHPMHKDRVKFDALDNEKRVFKTLLSIHKKHPYAVIPLNPSHIHIDFNRAKLPVSDEVLSEAEKWYTTHDKDGTVFGRRLDVYTRDVLNKYNCHVESGHIEISETPIPMDCFPPCIKNILKRNDINAGKTRAITLLATFLGQCGWSGTDAQEMFSRKAADIKAFTSNIFESWFRRMSTPSCQTIRTMGGGFPRMEMGELNICTPDNVCRKIKNPYWYAKSMCLLEQKTQNLCNVTPAQIKREKKDYGRVDEKPYDKKAYEQAKQRKYQYLQMLSDFWKKTQTDAAQLQTTGKEKILQDILSFNFRVVPTIRKRDGAWSITKWTPYDEWASNSRKQKIDYYTTLPNEIVIKSDFIAKNKEDIVDAEQTWNHPLMGQKTMGDKLRETLKTHHINHHIGFGGGKGPHISIYYSLPDKETITRMEKKGIRARDLRLFLFHKILDLAKIPKDYRTTGGIIDTSCVDLSEVSDACYLNRCFGGRKITETGMVEYKTLFTDGVPDQKPNMTNFTKVIYPGEIKTWSVPPEFLSMLIDTFKPSGYKPLSKNIIITGKHINLPCMLLIRLTPVPIGSRRKLCEQLAYACIKDKNLFSDGLEVCGQFYSNAEKQDFDFSEAKYVFEQAYRKKPENTHIYCSVIRKHGFCDDHIKEKCEFYKMRRKEFIDQKNKKKYRITKTGVQYYMGVPINDSMQPEHLKPYSQVPREWMKKKKKYRRK